MARLVDEPDIYAVIVIVPRSDPSHEPVPVTVNGRDAEHQRVVDALCEGYDGAADLEAMAEDDARLEAGF